jgi:PKD repeat protein
VGLVTFQWGISTDNHLAFHVHGDIAVKTKRIILPGIALACLFLTSSVAEAAVNARITASRTRCTAPCAVFFHADGTTSDRMNSDEVFLFLDYEWRFGDSSAGTWRTGALANTGTPQSKNLEYGPTAGHLFERPGSYTVQLTVCTSDGSSCDTERQLITVSNPNTVYPRTETVCVGNSRPVAGSGGCPAGAKVVRSADFDDAFANGANCGAEAANAHVRCLFKRGDTFTASRQVDMSSANGVQIGAFGSGNKPVIRASGNFTLFDDNVGWEDWTFYDLEIAASGSGDDCFRLTSRQAKATHFSLIRITIDGWDAFVSAPITNAAHDGRSDLSGFYVSELERVTTTPGQNYWVFGGFRDMWLAGMTLGDPRNNDGGDPSQAKFMRFAGIQRGFIGHSLVGQGGGNSEQIAKIHNVHRARAGSGRAATHSVQIVDNEFVRVGDEGWQVSLAPQSASTSGADELVRRFVIERNWYHSDQYVGGTPTNTRPFMLGNTEQMMLRNNIIDCSARSDNVHSSCVAAKVADRRAAEPNPEDTYIYNNTVAHFGNETGRIGVAEVDSGTRNTDARANLLYVTGSARSRIWNSVTPSPNIANLEAGSDPFVGGRLGMRPEHFKLGSADNVAVVPGVRRDFSGAIRTGGHTRGAWNRTGSGSSGGSQPQPPAAPVLLPPE